MLPLHDRTRRRLCFAAFLAVCVAPTVLVLILGVWRHLPGYVRAEAERLGWQLGTKVSLRRIRHLRPGVMVYEGLELFDPETSRLILRCSTLQTGWRTVANRKGRKRSCLVLSASQVEVNALQLNDVWQLVRRVLSRRSGMEADVRLAADEVSFRPSQGRQTLTDVSGKIEMLPTVAQADLAFRLADAATPEPVQLRVARTQGSEGTATAWGLYTGGGALSCDALAMRMPGLEVLDSETRFCGSFWVNESPEGPSGVLAGEFSEVELEALLGDRFPYTLRGSGRLTIGEARFGAGRLEALGGSLVAGPGVISRSLLDAAAEELEMTRRPLPNVSGDVVPYDRLEVAFQIDSRGLQLRGQRSPAGSGVILVGRYGPLLGEPLSQPVPIAALLRALAPSGAVRVPATRQTEWLMRRLPIPDARPAAMADASSRPGRVRTDRGTVE